MDSLITISLLTSTCIVCLLYVVEYYGDREVYEYPGDVPVFLYLYNATKESDKPLTDFILTTWTNFAKSGWDFLYHVLP